MDKAKEIARLKKASVSLAKLVADLESGKHESGAIEIFDAMSSINDGLSIFGYEVK